MGAIGPIRKYGEIPYFSDFTKQFQRHGYRFAFCILLAGCVTVPTPTENPRQVWCDHSQPRRDATADTPRAELDEINRHNALGTKWCNWTP